MKSILSVIFVQLLIHTISFTESNAQGCVAIRGIGGELCTNNNEHNDTSLWSLTINTRSFKSYKHFVGLVEQKERVENKTEVINHSFSTDLFIQRNINSKYAIGCNIPIISNVRSSLYEHGGNNAGPAGRHATHSFGIGDLRIVGYAWLKDPINMPRWNVQLGVGLKLPTGDYNYTDYFYKNDTTKILGPVDQSIQLGDGGTGMSIEVNSFYAFTHQFSVYGNFFYLSNPREQNGVSTARGGTPSTTSIAYGSNTMSVPDQYMYRVGVSYMNKHISANIAIRKDGIPAIDVIGKSGGFRRPGYVVAIEPGMAYKHKKITYFINTPIALQRNRTQSVPDKIRTQKSGVYYKGDAAFADYLINIGASVKL
ncbi:MAG: hypothetical protein ACK5AO_05230 [bacterium]